MMTVAAMIWGLGPLDLAVIIAFLIAILWIGFHVSRSVRKETDFYLGGRKLGRTLQFFLNFGNATDSTGAVTVSTAVYQDGAGGIWLGFQTLFITPFFWFTQPWWRRARLVTMGDLFTDRFRSESLASAYALFNIFMALFTLGMGNFYSFKVAQAMIVKPPSAYTTADRRRVADYEEYRKLKSEIENGQLAIAGTERYKILDSQSKRAELQSFVSYLKPLPFYIGYSAVVGTYIALGGLRAAAITDAIQGLLILLMSILLIPMGLGRLGGMRGLHAVVPEYLFHITSDLAWYSVLAITFTSLVQMIGLLHNMSTAGSATNESTARFGLITGGFTKRLVLIAWMVCGLIALGILRGNLHLADPDNAWGALSRQLLGPGLFGLMLSGMLLGHMPMVGVYAVSVAGLATRNIYEPIVRGKSERHYLRVGQWAIAGVLIVAIAFAMCMSNVVSVYTDFVTFNTFFGAAIFLMLFWRRVTAAAVWGGLVIWIVVMGLIPRALPQDAAFRRLPGLLVQTYRREQSVTVGATPGDVAAGLARKVGVAVKEKRIVPPQAVFFDAVARVNPSDPHSPLEGIGRFNVEDYALHLLGAPVRQFTDADMTAVRWGFDGLFPFIVLVVLSFLTSAREVDRAERFFAKMRTPIAPTVELDRHEVELSYQSPHRFDDRKIWPRSNWQFARWTTNDWLGFGGCWLIVGAILLVLWGVLHIG